MPSLARVIRARARNYVGDSRLRQRSGMTLEPEGKLTRVKRLNGSGDAFVVELSRDEACDASADAQRGSQRAGRDLRECHANGAVILRAWVNAARATRRGLTPVFEQHG
jgi:hypothetical protein